MTPSDQTQGLWWTLDFASDQLSGMPPLDAQVYSNATRWPFEAPGQAGQDVTGDGRGCNMSTGEFQIESITMSGGTLQDFTATFLQYCDGGPALRGCVHFAQ